MAKKLQGLSRVLGPRPLASVAYGEIASSLYFALGIVAFYAMGFTPWVLLAVGIVFVLVALSYAEGTAAIPETGGAATLVRRAFRVDSEFPQLRGHLSRVLHRRAVRLMDERQQVAARALVEEARAIAPPR